MGYVKLVTITCDTCFATADASAWTVEQARGVARSDGWTRTRRGEPGNKWEAPSDLCPDCTAARA